jgi:hypothetical protein
MHNPKMLVAQTILTQIISQNPSYKKEYNVKNMMSLSDKGGGLRLNTHQNSNTVNIDIIYDLGKDTYEIKAYKFNLKKMIITPKAVYDADDIYFEQLDDAIKSAIKTAKITKLKNVI